MQIVLNRYAEIAGKPLYVFFDEVDCLGGETLITFLRQLRNGKIDMGKDMPFPSSVALIGMRDIRDYKAKIRPYAETSGSASPFNVITKAMTLRTFTGEKTRATPGGRHDGDRLAQGLSPSEFRCKEGATTVINAIGTLPHELLYASNANLSFDKTAMTAEILAAVFRVTAEKRLHLLQPNCTSVEELVDAKEHPERHQDLIVKVCGFSARFIALSPKFQDEIIARHRLK